MMTRPAREPARAGGFGSRRTSQYEQRPSDDATLDRLLRRAAASRRPDDPLRFDAPPGDDATTTQADAGRAPPDDHEVTPAGPRELDRARAYEALLAALESNDKRRPRRDAKPPRPVTGAPPAPVVEVSTNGRYTILLFADGSVRSLPGFPSFPARARTRGTRAEVRTQGRERPAERSRGRHANRKNRRERRGRHLPGPARGYQKGGV